MKTVTGREFVDAIEKNGLSQTYGWYFEGSTGTDYIQNTDSPLNIKGKITSACAVGQAAINLSIVPYTAGAILPERFNSLITRVIQLNDESHLSFEQIAQALREEYFDLDAMGATFEEFDYSEIVEK